MSGHTLEMCAAVNAAASVYFELKSLWLGFWSGCVFLSDHWRSAEIRGWQQNREELNPKAGVLKWIYCFSGCLEYQLFRAWVFLCSWCWWNLHSFFFSVLCDNFSAGWLRASDTFTRSFAVLRWSLLHTSNRRPIFFFTPWKLWHDSLMYSAHQQQDMGIDRLDCYGDDVLL